MEKVLQGQEAARATVPRQGGAGVAERSTGPGQQRNLGLGKSGRTQGLRGRPSQGLSPVWPWSKDTRKVARFRKHQSSGVRMGRAFRAPGFNSKCIGTFLAAFG